MDLVTFGLRHTLIKLQHPLRHFPLDSIMFVAIKHEINCFALVLFFFSQSFHSPILFHTNDRLECKFNAIGSYELHL